MDSAIINTSPLAAALHREPDRVAGDGTKYRAAVGEGRIKYQEAGNLGSWKLHSKHDTPESMAAEWERLTGVRAAKSEPCHAEIVAESAPSHDALADNLQNQYRAALGAYENAVNEAVKFGLMLAEADTVIARVQLRSKGGRIAGRESGLKAWLAEHCPTINYHTAMRWRRVAEDVSKRAPLPQDTDFAMLLQAPESPVAKALDATLDKVINGRSMRQMMFDFSTSEPAQRGGARPGSGRPHKDPDPQAELTEALIVSDKLVGNLRHWALEEDRLGVLPDDKLENLLTQLGDVERRGRDILRGRKIAAKTRGIK